MSNQSEPLREGIKYRFKTVFISNKNEYLQQMPTDLNRNSAILACLLSLFCITCNNSPSNGPDQPQKDTLVKSLTQKEIMDNKPKFPGFVPQPFIIGEDTTYIRVVANSPNLEKAWMVYYDLYDGKWATISWQGYGQHNKIIGDTIFTRKNGLVNGSSSDDAPEFYFAYSEDSGRTWKPHQINEAGMYCKKLLPRQRANILLVSEPFLNNTDRTYLGMIFQWRNIQPTVITTGILSKLNFDFYCEVARDIR